MDIIHDLSIRTSLDKNHPSPFTHTMTPQTAAAKPRARDGRSGTCQTASPALVLGIALALVLGRELALTLEAAAARTWVGRLRRVTD